MPNFLRVALFGFTVLLFFACKKEKVIKNEDNFVEQTEEFSALKPEASAIGEQFLEVQWKTVSNTHFKAVSYSIYLDDQKIIEGLKTTKYSLINLKGGQAYSIKIIASTNDGKQVQETLKASTLSAPTDGSQQTLYKEYNIHSYSTFTGSTGLKRFSDGSHVVVRFLRHPDYFGDGTFKIIVFKIDKYGNMLWYRLLPTSGYEISIMDDIRVAFHNEDKEGLIFIRGYVFKFATNDGKIISEKDFRSILGQQSFQSIFYASSQEIITGTGSGNLLSINPQTLNVNWHRTNPDRLGSIVSINMDSKKNIYYIFRDYSEQYRKVRVHKCDAQGIFISDFLFDGTLPNESNWGFWMTTILIDEADNLYMFGYNSDYNFLRYFKFSAEGKLLKKNEQSDVLLATQAFFNSKGEIVVVGRRDGSGFATYGGIYVFDKDLNIKSKRYYTEIPFHIFSGLTANPDGSYNIFLHYMQTYSYENSNFVFVKTDVNGQM